LATVHYHAKKLKILMMKIMINDVNMVNLQEDDILNGNTLLGELVGMVHVNDAPDDYPDGYFISENDETEAIPLLPDDWCFHWSWDWIMNVVSAIENIKTGGINTLVVISSTRVLIQTFSPEGCLIEYNQHEDNFMPSDMYEVNGYVNQTKFTFNDKISIVPLWLAAVKFAKWHKNANLSQ